MEGIAVSAIKRQMRVVVVGSGGREHTIIKKIRENPEVTEVFALPGNGGIAMDAICVDIGAKDIEGCNKSPRKGSYRPV